MYSDNPYQFVSAHLGAWDANDVEETDMTAFRNETYLSDNARKNDLTLKEFSALILNTVVANHIPVDDFYNNLGWNLYNFSQYFRDNDNTHPRKGFEYIAKKMIGFITSRY